VTLEEAIETIESIKHVCRTLFPPKEQAALSLGIEALKLVQRQSPNRALPGTKLLPGETDE